MARYCELDDLKNWLSVGDEVDDTILETCLTAAETSVDSFCGRQFTVASGTSARQYWPDDWCKVSTDDFAYTSTLSVSVDTGNDGSYDTALVLDTDYFAQPVNRNYAGTSGAPYTFLTTTGARRFPIYHAYRPTVQVTAEWGWVAVPEPVKQATKIKAASIYRRMNTPDGIAAGGDFGAIRISIKQDPTVAELLAPLCKGGQAAGLVVA